MRLAKYIAHAGAASRRAAEELIRAGRVEVDGAQVRDPARDVDGSQHVTLDGRALAGPERRVVYAVHKPAGWSRPPATHRAGRRSSGWSRPMGSVCIRSGAWTPTRPG